MFLFRMFFFFRKCLLIGERRCLRCRNYRGTTADDDSDCELDNRLITLTAGGLA